MFDDLKGKRVLVTGSSQGIGLAVVEAFARAGAKVGMNGRRAPADLEQTLARLNGIAAEAGGEVAFFAADVAASGACAGLVEAFVARFGGLDVLVNNAGGLIGRTPLEEIDDGFFDAVTNLNARSALMMTRFAVPHLRASAAASGTTAAVISVGSVAGYTGGGPGAGLYGAAKAWLHNIQKNWVTFHAKDGIRFNMVSPGVIDTAFHADKDADTKAAMGRTMPMGRIGTPEDCAPAFLFFASHACSGYVTGQVLDVNGGQFMP